MAIKLPSRNYFTFDELQSRWQCDTNDLCHAVVIGEVKPSVRLNGEFECLTWELGPDGDWEGNNLFDTSAYNLRIRPRDWFYLQDPVQTGAFDCEFHLAADHRDATKSDVPFELWIRLPHILTMESVRLNCVFQMKEVLLYETKYGDDLDSRPDEAPVRGKERNTYLLMIAALANKAGLDPAHHKSASSIATAIELLGTKVTAETIRDKLDKIPSVITRREIVVAHGSGKPTRR